MYGLVPANVLVSLLIKPKMKTKIYLNGSPIIIFQNHDLLSFSFGWFSLSTPIFFFALIPRAFFFSVLHIYPGLYLTLRYISPPPLTLVSNGTSKIPFYYSSNKYYSSLILQWVYTCFDATIDVGPSEELLNKPRAHPPFYSVKVH